MSLSKMASTSTFAQVIIDADYLDTYNKEHETDLNCILRTWFLLRMTGSLL